jgi:hypothetical protein
VPAVGIWSSLREAAKYSGNDGAGIFNTDPMARGGERSNYFIPRGGKFNRGRSVFGIGAPPSDVDARVDSHQCLKRPRGVMGPELAPS